MKLPDNSIGVTDLINYNECPRRFAFNMRRHTEGGPSPQADSFSNAYGSCFHEVVGYAAATGCTDDEALQYGFDGRYGRWLDPELMERLKADLATYRARDYVGVKLVAVEEEMRVPLFIYEGVQIYYRFRVDRLYQRLDDPSIFLHIDYKTSKHPKPESEIHDDVQISAYNWALHELYPEIGTLIQLYDQLLYGRVPTRRTPEERASVKEWLIRQATAVLRDETLEPTLNDFCAFCAIMPDCPVITDLTNYALGHIAGLAPEEKIGRATKLNLDPQQMETYVAQMEVVGRARRVLERYEDTVRSTLREMPAARRQQLGYKLSTPVVEEWTPEAIQAILRTVGPEQFCEMVSLTKTAVDRLPKAQADMLRTMMTRRMGAPRLAKIPAKDLQTTRADSAPVTPGTPVGSSPDPPA